MPVKKYVSKNATIPKPKDLTYSIIDPFEAEAMLTDLVNHKRNGFEFIASVSAPSNRFPQCTCVTNYYRKLPVTVTDEDRVKELTQRFQFQNSHF